MREDALASLAGIYNIGQHDLRAHPREFLGKSLPVPYRRAGYDNDTSGVCFIGMQYASM
jgi:hypothetical protein